MGRVNAFVLITFLSAAVTLGLWIPSAVLGTTDATLSKQLFVSFTILCGLFASAYVSLFPAILVELFGLQHLPYVTGVLYTVQGMAAIVGTPVAGILVRGSDEAKHSSDYTEMAVLVGALMFAASICVVWVRFEVMANSTSEKRRKWKM
jgi:MFS family permease